MFIKTFWCPFGVLFLTVSCVYSHSACVEENPCLCKINEYSQIDLSSLFANANENNYKPLITPYINSNETHAVHYFFSGCKDKSIDPKDYNLPASDEKPETGSLIKYEFNVTTNKTNSNLTVLGKASDITFDFAVDNAGDYRIVYKNSSNQNSPTIRLACTDFKSSYLEVSNPSTAEFVLFSPSACVKTEHSGLSTGSKFLILFFISVLIYFIGGGLVLYFVRGARGIEIIPNIDFWRNLPSLVKDGFIFLLGGCRPTYVSTAETYDRI